MLGIVTGGAMAFMALLILSLIVLCLMQKSKSKSFGETRTSRAGPTVTGAPSSQSPFSPYRSAS